jgi:vitamin B12 transporter
METRAMTRPFLTALLGGSALCLAGPVLAQTPVDPVIVTAERLPAPLTLTPDAYVVTEDDIARRQPSFAADVLAEVPGVSISEEGAFGGISSLRLRGATSDKTLVLIDGVSVNDPSQPAGGYDFSSTDMADIVRIEVLTGPQGALWGSDAIGGVVALTSREPNGLGLHVEGGSLNTLQTSATLGQATQTWAIGASVATYRTDGVSKADEKDGNTERDGFKTSTYTANLRFSPNDRITLDARARYNQAFVEYDGFGGPTGVIDSNDYSNAWYASGYVRAQVKDVLGFDQELRADLMALDRDYFGAYPYSAQGDQQVYRWSAQRQRGLYGLDFGVDYKAASENTGDGPAREDALGYYAIGRLTPTQRLSLTVSVRRDDPQHYRGQTTARVAGAYALGAGFTVTGSVGQGFKAPSIYETTYPCFECTVPGPNAGLKPERAVGWDGGLAWRSAHGALEVQATYFSLNVRDQIDYIYPTGYLNLERVRSTGVEADVKARLAHGWSLHGAYTHDDAVDAATGQRLLKVPRDVGSGGLSWRGRGWTTDLGVRAQSDSPDVYGAIKPFAIAYATAGYAVTARLSLTARVENLMGSHYQEAFGYGEPGRMILVGLSWRQ